MISNYGSFQGRRKGGKAKKSRFVILKLDFQVCIFIIRIYTEIQTENDTFVQILTLLN